MNVFLETLKLAGLNTRFEQEFAAYNPGWDAFALPVPSTMDTENFGWLGDLPTMKELGGEPIPEGLKEESFSIVNKRFQTSVKVDRDDLADEKYGQLLKRISNLAVVAKAYPWKLVRNLRTAGMSTNCYDGTPFYGSSHRDGDSNLVTQTGTTDAQIIADAESAITLLNSMLTDKGEPYERANPRFVAVCSPTMLVKLRRNLLLTTVSTGGSNVFAGLIADVVCDQGLTGNNWYLDDVGAVLKAFIVQEREAVTPENTQPGSDMWVLHRKVLFTANWRGNGGYGQYKNSVKIG